MTRDQFWNEARQALLTDGYVHLPDVFTADEVRAVRDVIHRHLKYQKSGVAAGSFGRVEPLAALTLPTLRAFIGDSRIVEAVSGLLNTSKPEFLLHCDAHWNDLSVWHKDTGDTVVPDGYFGCPTYHYDQCLVVKLAVYCEDHIDDDGGLHVKRGSHRTSEIETGEELAIATRVGDVVAFDVRVTHMGARNDGLHRRMNGVNKRINSFSKRAPTRIKNQLDSFLTSADARINNREDRTSLFFSFAAEGIESDLTYMFARRNWERGCRQAKRSFDVPNDIMEAFSLLNVDVATI